jgi:putative spermidine/putrescine transport system ATP-binding protein/spermidine/putrescine transport system ATP-binding protein
VAQFIGRNTLIPGTVKSTGATETVVDTAFGALAGSPTGQAMAAGQKASLVLPAEAVDIVPDAVGDAELRAAYGSCTIPVAITSLQQVGHLLQMAVQLPNGQTMAIEGHTDKYGGRFAAGDKAKVAWKSSGATVISH